MNNVGVFLKCATCKKESCNQEKYLSEFRTVMSTAQNNSELKELLKEIECKDYEED